MVKAILIALFMLTSVEIGTTVTYAYTVRVLTTPTHVKETGMAKAIIEATEGFKWNKEYPASFEFMHYESVIATPLKEKTHFKEGKLCVPYIGKLKGRAPMVVAANFSVCNEQECLIYRNEKIVLSLIVK